MAGPGLWEGACQTRAGRLPTTWACKGRRPWLEEGACQLPVRAQLQMSRQNRVFRPSLGHGADASVDGPQGRCRPARPSDNSGLSALQVRGQKCPARLLRSSADASGQRAGAD